MSRLLLFYHLVICIFTGRAMNWIHRQPDLLIAQDITFQDDKIVHMYSIGLTKYTTHE